MQYIERGSSRSTYKRCAKKWYWRYKLGLIPKERIFGATDLGTWVHNSLALWRQVRPEDRHRAELEDIFKGISSSALEWAKRDGAPDHVLEKGDELALLGEDMMRSYQNTYGSEEERDYLAVEVALDFAFEVELYPDSHKTLVTHMLKPDAVFRDAEGYVWLDETKTAQSVNSLEYLALDDQARPYGSMAERALKKAGILKEGESLRGIMYNFLRKGWVDDRLKNDEGLALNKNGTVSARQPAPLLKRHPVFMSRKAKAITLHRVQMEMAILSGLTRSIREKRIDPMWIPKTPNKSCNRCEFFRMCIVEDEGGSIKDMMNSQFVRRDPYSYEDTETDETPDFDMG